MLQHKQVARWAFPGDLNQVYAIACLGQREGEWSGGEMLVKDGRVREMWQVGEKFTIYDLLF